MWIAKPIKELTPEEKSFWKPVETRLPLAQSLGWGYGIEAMSGRSYLVFSPDEKIGGMVFTNQSPSENEIHFECINGPFLQWDNPTIIPRQFATFVTAVSKLDQRFYSLTVKPRWDPSTTQKRLSYLPVPTFQQSQAATLVISIRPSLEEQFLNLSPRMRRTLNLAKKNSVHTECEIITPETLRKFVPPMQAFAKKNGFMVPDLSWFEVITKQFNFWLITSKATDSKEESCVSQILVCQHDQKAHYLFGYENRSPNMRSAISTAASAQWEAIARCSSLGIKYYDLNGYIVNSQPSNPYYGVCKFKEQFQGSVIQYDIPEFVIQL